MKYLFAATFLDGTPPYYQNEADVSVIYDNCKSEEDFLQANIQAFGHEPVNDAEKEAWKKPCKNCWYDVKDKPIHRFMLFNDDEEHGLDLTTGHFFVNGHEIRMHNTKHLPLRNIKLYFYLMKEVDMNSVSTFDGEEWQLTEINTVVYRHTGYRFGFTCERLRDADLSKGIWEPFEVIREIDI